MYFTEKSTGGEAKTAALPTSLSTDMATDYGLSGTSCDNHLLDPDTLNMLLRYKSYHEECALYSRISRLFLKRWIMYLKYPEFRMPLREILPLREIQELSNEVSKRVTRKATQFLNTLKPLNCRSPTTEKLPPDHKVTAPMYEEVKDEGLKGERIFQDL